LSHLQGENVRAKSAAAAAAVMVFVFVTDLLCRRGILQRDFFLLLLFPAMSTYQSLIVTKQRRTCEMMMVSFFWGMASSDGVFSFSRAASMQQEGDAGIWFSA
jgi:hypothetical protein